MSIIDLLLLPKKVYQKLSGKRSTLILSILLVGIADMVFSFVDNYSKIFVSKEPIILYFNITLGVVLTILVGFIDILFFSMPLFDLFKIFSKEEPVVNGGEQLIKIMKVYALANVLIVPLNLVLYIAFRNMGEGGSVLLSILVNAATLWLAAAASRGINCIYKFIPPLKKMVFITVFMWGSILSVALGYMVDNWLMLLFR